LEQACGEDVSLREEVESLLGKLDTPSLASPAADLMARAAAAELAPGTMLAHYRVEAKLGEGGMGAVYRASDTRLQRQVAIKVLLPEHLDDPNHAQQLLREARAASALNHPNIVTVHEVGSERGVDFIAMEYVAGRSLAGLIPTKGLGVKRALDYAVQIAEGLAQAHAAGVVHGDLKPGNVMVNGGGRIKLLDFGLARRVRLTADQSKSLTVKGEIAGTPAYMAPEQAEGKKADERTDIFAFGAVLYEMLAGRRAFQGASTLAVLGAVLREEPPSVAGVPHELERILRRCLRKDPARRFQHIGDVRIELEEVGAVEPAPIARKWRPWLFAAALSLVLIAAARFGAPGLGRRTAAVPAPGMVQLTADVGLTFQPAISADGKLVAYSSDRGGAGNLDIWVQQMSGGDSVQLTKDPADDSEPAFSPDGSQIAFRSEREGGAIYVVPALGGEPKLIALRGRLPRFSPDGGHIAYGIGKGVTGLQGLFTPAIFVVASRGGPARRLDSGLIASGVPVWAPDGQHLICWGRQEADSDRDWWVVPVSDGPARRTRLRDILVDRNLFPSYTTVSAWIGDRLILSINLASGSDLWQIPISSRTGEVAGEPQRLTFASGSNIQPSVSAGGQVVFSSKTVNRNVWSVAVDADGGKIRGELRRLTQEAKSNRDPAVSPDGRKVAFVAGWDTPRAQLRIRDVATGKESPLSGIPSTRDLGYPSFSADSSKVVFRAIENARPSLYVVLAAGGMAERICENCGNAPAWSPDGTKIVYDRIDRRRYVGLLETATGRTTQIVKHPEYDFIQPQFCPGDSWISFACMYQPDRTRVMVAPFRGAAIIPESDWIAVTDGSGFDSRPRWSPNGNLLYFISDRDGFRCIWAQRLDANKRRVGPAFAVRHFDDPRRLLSDIPELGLSVARDKLVFNMIEQTGNLWTFQLPPEK
jgi:Tol biopolymer transport system component/predicted Ser/Thr protein kinase